MYYHRCQRCVAEPWKSDKNVDHCPSCGTFNIAEKKGVKANKEVAEQMRKDWDKLWSGGGGGVKSLQGDKL